MKIKNLVAMGVVLSSALLLTATSTQADVNQDKINKINSQVNSLMKDIEANQKDIDKAIANEKENSKLIVHYKLQQAKQKSDLNNKARAYQTYQNNGGMIGTFLESKSITQAISASVQAGQMMRSVQNSIDDTHKLEDKTEKELEHDKKTYASLENSKKDLEKQINDLKGELNRLQTIASEKAATEKDKQRSLNIARVAQNAIDNASSNLAQQVASEQNQSEGAPDFTQSDDNTPAPALSPTPDPAPSPSPSPSPSPQPDPTPQPTPESQIYNGPWATLPKYGIGFTDGECTRGVSILKGGHVPLNWGDAKFWAANAQAAGIPTGYKPAVGAIVAWAAGENMGAFNAGPYGHVAVVTSASPDGSYTIKEMNGAAGHGVFGERAAAGGIFIYIR